jgi:hypothetical protein
MLLNNQELLMVGYVYSGGLIQKTSSYNVANKIPISLRLINWDANLLIMGTLFGDLGYA